MNHVEPEIVFGRPVIGEEEIAAAADALRSGWIGAGPRVEEFERRLEACTGAGRVRCVASGSTALLLALRAVGIGPGDEVLLPSMTFVATASAVENLGARCVLVDSEPGTGLIDLDAAAARVGPRTRAIVPVLIGGRPVDADRVADLARTHQLRVVYDAAHAMGAEWNGRPVGARGDAVAFSFGPTKGVTAIEGGAVATPHEDVADRVATLARHGLSVGPWSRYSKSRPGAAQVVEPGLNATMSDVHAAIGLVQLGKLDAEVEIRAERAAHYDELLAGLTLEMPPPMDPRGRHSRLLYQVLVPDRDRVLARLASNGVFAGVHFVALHLQPWFRGRDGIRPADFPVATDISARTLSLPLSSGVTEADQVRVADELRKALAQSERGAVTG